MKHILAVDDNPANLTLVRETLKEKYKVTVVTSGDQALRFLQKQSPDLILLDVMMPGMDGLQTMKEMQKLPSPPDKVCFLTALAEQDMVEDGKALGAIACLPKPIRPNELCDFVKGVLGE